eukprot:s4329_g2.t1
MPNNLASYDFDKIKILKSTVKPKDLKTLLPPSVLPFIADFRHHVERDPLEVQAELATDPNAMPRMPYWDPVLRSQPHERMRLLRQMFQIGLVDLQPVIRAKAGIFFVKKKTPEFIRLIVDGRQANFNHKRPPITRLGSASCLAELRIKPGRTAYAREMDVSDCFYQFRIDEAAAWFGLDEPLPYEAWRYHGFEVDSVYDSRIRGRRSVASDEILYPVVSAMSMGWSWALFLANETIASIVRESSKGPPLELRERLPVPVIEGPNTVSSTYVDNVTIFGEDFEQVAKRCEEVDRSFAQHGIPVVWTQPQPVQTLETVGCRLDLLAGTLSNKTSRIWRVHLAGLELVRRGRVQVSQVEVWLGHATSLFRLRPCLLSVFDKIYKFIELGRGKRFPLWPSVRKEIKLASHLVCLAHVNLRSSFINQIDAGDSADHGYALMTRSLPDFELERLIRFKERWRYIALPTELADAIHLEDKNKLINLIEQKTGVTNHSIQVSDGFNSGHVRTGCGIDTEYGQWLQQVIEDGDWKKTSAIASQSRAKVKRKADVKWPALVEPVKQQVLDPSKYRLLWAKRWRNSSAHISLKEALVALSSLKRTARVASLSGMTKITLCDNLAVVLCFEKGRSSSPSLNRLCRISAAFQCGLGICWRLRHIESPRNVADGPSRWFERVRGPEVRWIEMKKTNGIPVLCLDKYLDSAKPQIEQLGPPGLDQSHCQQRSVPGCNTSGEGERKVPLVSRAVQQGEFSDCSKGKEFSFSSQGSQDSAPSGLHNRVKASKNRKMMMEIFSGSMNLSKACEKKKLFVLASIDIKQGSHFDLTNREVQEEVIRIIRSGLIHYVHFGTPCTVFSVARKGIRNLERARYKERLGCELAFFTARAVEACIQHGVAWSIENPLSSALWDLWPIQQLGLRSDTYMVEFPMCAYGAPFKKMTRLLTNLGELCSLNRGCFHLKHSEVLAGKVKVSSGSGYEYMNKTELAGAYPKGLAETWSSVLRRVFGPCADETQCLADRGRASQVKGITLGRYQQAVTQFESWAEKMRKSLGPAGVDRTMVEYLHELCEQGHPIIDARSTLFGFILLRLDSPAPEKFLMPQSKAALKGWTSRFPTHSRAGVDLKVWNMIAWQCWRLGYPVIAAAILLQGDLYLRPSELLGLTRQMVIRPLASRAKVWGVVIAQQEQEVPTKTGTFDDCVLLDTCCRDYINGVLKKLFLKTKLPGDKIFPDLTLGQYAKIISAACSQLELQKLKLTPHGLRHSGPSTDAFHQIRGAIAIQRRGRWRTASSVTRYQKPGRMLLLHQHVDDFAEAVEVTSTRIGTTLASTRPVTIGVLLMGGTTMALFFLLRSHVFCRQEAQETQVPLPNGEVPDVDRHEVPLTYRSDAERVPLV